jgi:hypothetical protein
MFNKGKRNKVILRLLHAHSVQCTSVVLHFFSACWWFECSKWDIPSLRRTEIHHSICYYILVKICDQIKNHVKLSICMHGIPTAQLRPLSKEQKSMGNSNIWTAISVSSGGPIPSFPRDVAHQPLTLLRKRQLVFDRAQSINPHGKLVIIRPSSQHPAGTMQTHVSCV